MENFEYAKVRTTYTKNQCESTSWKYFYRQLLVCSVSYAGSFVTGLFIGGPTVYIPQIRKEANSTEVISETMGSLIMSIYSYASIPWVIILPILATYFGRKKSIGFALVLALIGTVTFYTSHTVTQLLISEVIECILGSMLLTISNMVITEYTSAEFRGFLLTLKPATFASGIWVSNAIGTFFHWRIIGLIKVIFSIYPVIAVFFWPESPLWLASKGQFKECAEAHRWLKGSNENSEQDLQTLLSSQRHVTETTKFSFAVVRQKKFYKGVMLGLCSLSVYSFSGKLPCVFYALMMLKKMTSSESTAYIGMLILDGVTVFAMFAGTILSKYFKRRTLYFSTSLIGIASLFILSLHVYLVSVSILSENAYISITLLSVYSLFIGCGPALYSSSLYAETLPIKSRSFAMFIVTIPDLAILGVIMQLTPVIMRKFGLHIVFLCFAIPSTILIFILYIFLPETKDKSLYEIENSIIGKTKNVDEETQLN